MLEVKLFREYDPPMGNAPNAPELVLPGDSVAV